MSRPSQHRLNKSVYNELCRFVCVCVLASKIGEEKNAWINNGQTSRAYENSPKLNVMLNYELEEAAENSSLLLNEHIDKVFYQPKILYHPKSHRE